MKYFNISHKIKVIRESLSISQRDLADKMEVPQSTVVRIESGEINISAAILEKFCAATGYEFEFINKENNLVFQVCDYIIDFCKKRLGSDYDVTNMKLNKLLYYVYKEYLKNYKSEQELFPNYFYAWEHGPVYKDIYYKYSSFKQNVIDLENVNYVNLSQDQINIIDSILDKIYTESAYKLRKDTHKEHDWMRARAKGDNVLICFI
jgi:uncharacterized phage-associated protein/DNA-binding XRE family transcriptional regulator